jgi:prevent-host-death family protein
MPHVYSTWEAKAKFSEIVRKVREGQTVYVSYRGETVAEIRPLDSKALTVEERIAALEKAGSITPAVETPIRIEAVARRSGALERFLESRD